MRVLILLIRAASFASSFSACSVEKAKIPPPLFGLLVGGWELVDGRDCSSLSGIGHGFSHPDDEASVAVWSWSGIEHEATTVGGWIDFSNGQDPAVASPWSPGLLQPLLTPRMTKCYWKGRWGTMHSDQYGNQNVHSRPLSELEKGPINGVSFQQCGHYLLIKVYEDMKILVQKVLQKYSCGQTFAYTCKEHVYHSSLEFPIISTTLFFFCDGMIGVNTSLSQKNIHEFWFFYEFIMGLLKMWPNLLGQKYTYSNANIWLHVPWPFSTQLGAFGSHPQVSGKLLVESLTTPLDRIGAVQLNLLAFWHGLVSSAQSTCSRWGSSQDFKKAILKA